MLQKTDSERVVQKTAEVTGDLLEIIQLIKLLHQAKQKVKKKMKDRKSTQHQKKRQQIIDDLRLF